MLGVLDTGEDAIVITECGVEKYEIRRRQPVEDPLTRLEAQGLITPAAPNPAPWPPYESASEPDPGRVDRLIDEMKGDH
ncbi:hypothetical protein [Sediminivirga luteola]|uniref:hypothetical protein n=1 Tax=Sediminivirga luteola TaxID=1774748 RepID=UPI00166A7B1C|nr:hypothetical protein [Sediminivirga luteola]